MPSTSCSWAFPTSTSCAILAAVNALSKRFNEHGIDGLIYRPPPGRPRKLGSEEVAATILPLVDDPASAGQTQWPGTKLC